MLACLGAFQVAPRLERRKRTDMRILRRGARAGKHGPEVVAALGIARGAERVEHGQGAREIGRRGEPGRHGPMKPKPRKTIRTTKPLRRRPRPS